MTDHANQGYPRPRKRGRPKLGEGEGRPRQTLHLDLHADIYDAVCRIALRRGISVRAAARELIEDAASSGGNGDNGHA